ncbi:MAG: isopeptide-forming domain-containing fimbrial protein [Clostridiales bacterium]|nr:isopeptide-forming domain-containing fimbrial protein [Clostridiales bacterium]
MTKRILSVLLALVLVLAMTTVALADAVVYQNYDLTINDIEDGRIYTIYQIFKGNQAYSDDGPIFTDVDWGTDVNSAALLTALGLESDATAADAVEALSKKSGKDAADIIKDCTTGAGTAMPATAGGKTTKNVQSGYYFVQETTADVATTSAFILQVVTATAVETKRSDVPDTDKKIVDGENKVNVSDNNIGDVITFEISAVVPTNYDKYDPYTLIFHDTMGEGLTYNKDAAITGTSAGTISFDEDANKLTVDFGDISNLPNLAGKTITVTYTATLNENAVIAGAGNVNEFYVEYTNAPDVDDDKDETSTTPKKYAVVFTFELIGDKYDSSSADKSAKLAEAKFVLQNAAGEYMKKVDGKITWVASQDDATELVSATNGSFGVEGLDAGVYTLIETEAPAGYNKLTEGITFEIIADYDTSVSPIALSNAAVPTAEVEVGNSKGTVLPSTGGRGTTMFYVIGGLLMAVAVVLLVAKKRTVND